MTKSAIYLLVLANQGEFCRIVIEREGFQIHFPSLRRMAVGATDLEITAMR